MTRIRRTCRNQHGGRPQHARRPPARPHDVLSGDHDGTHEDTAQRSGYESRLRGSIKTGHNRVSVRAQGGLGAEGSAVARAARPGAPGWAGLGLGPRSWGGAWGLGVGAGAGAGSWGWGWGLGAGGLGWDEMRWERRGPGSTANPGRYGEVWAVRRVARRSRVRLVREGPPAPPAWRDYGGDRSRGAKRSGGLRGVVPSGEHSPPGNQCAAWSQLRPVPTETSSGTRSAAAPAMAAQTRSRASSYSPGATSMSSSS